MNKNGVVHLMLPDIVNSYDTGQKNRDKPDTHHDYDEPMLEISGCEEVPNMIPRQAEKQVCEHPLC